MMLGWPLQQARDARLASAEVRVIQVGVERFFSDPEAAAELHRFELAGMDQPINRHLGQSEDGSNFGNGQEFASLEVAGQRSHAPWLY